MNNKNYTIVFTSQFLIMGLTNTKVEKAAMQYTITVYNFIAKRAQGSRSRLYNFNFPP